MKFTAAFIFCGLLAFGSFAAEKKIVLIAGPLDSHPLGTHEYENNILVLQHCLTSLSNAQIKTEVHFNGWPTNAATLDSADTIFLTSGGSDRNESDHPLYVGDRFAQLEKQMKRGCGIVMLHWSVFHPHRNHEKITEWLGGYFDYETGTLGPTNKWFSDIRHADWPVVTAKNESPILRGVTSFQLKDEFYFNIRFRENDPRLTPILFKETIGPKENIIAWSIERANGGRGFGFTCGHNFSDWSAPEFRKVVLNAILWTAKIEVPKNGVESSLADFKAPPSRKIKGEAK